MTIILASRGKILETYFAKIGFTCSTLEDKLIVIKLRPYSMLKYTLAQIQQCFQNFAMPSRSGDISKNYF